MKEKCSKLDFKYLANDVEPFLFDAEQKERVLGFDEEINTILL